MMSEIQWMNIFAGNLRSLLEENRMTQRELARETGLTEGTISRYLHAQCMPSVNALVNIANVFPCADICDLLYFGDSMDLKPSRRW